MRPERALRLHKETLAELNPDRLAKVLGYGPDSGPTCPGVICLAELSIETCVTQPCFSRFETCHCCTATASC